jgi:hypothetical protein
MILVLYDNHTKFGKRMPESYEKLLLPYDNPTIRPPLSLFLIRILSLQTAASLVKTDNPLSDND